MNWLTNFVKPKLRAIVGKKDVPENLWTKCSGCGVMLFHRDLAENLGVCNQCNQHHKISPKERFSSLFDKGDYENAKFQFETILSDHSGTSGIELAQYYLGKIEYDQGDNLTSREYLESFIKSGYSVDILKSSSVIMLSDILAKSNEIQKAVKIIEDGLELVDDEYLKNELKIEKAKLLIESQRIDEGSLILRDIYTKENISSDLKLRIEEIQGGNGV